MSNFFRKRKEKRAARSAAAAAATATPVPQSLGAASSNSARQSHASQPSTSSHPTSSATTTLTTPRPRHTKPPSTTRSHQHDTVTRRVSDIGISRSNDLPKRPKPPKPPISRSSHRPHPVRSSSDAQPRHTAHAARVEKRPKASASAVKSRAVGAVRSRASATRGNMAAVSVASDRSGGAASSRDCGPIALPGLELDSYWAGNTEGSGIPRRRRPPEKKRTRKKRPTRKKPGPGESAPSSDDSTDESFLTEDENESIQYKDLKLGSGRDMKHGDKVTFHYFLSLRGFREEGGKVVDSSIGRPVTLEYQSSSVIRGFNTGIQGMRVGGKRQVIIPGPVGYGEGGVPNMIPKNATLFFELELVKIG